MKLLGKGLIGLGLAGLIFLGYKYHNPFQKEVINLERFSDYYVSNVNTEKTTDSGEVENGGLEVLNSNFYVISKDYLIENEIASNVESTKEGVEEKSNESVRPEKDIYIVKSGDTLYDIAKQYGMDLDVLKANNPGIKSNLVVGDKINIVKGNGIFYKVQKGDSFYRIASKFRISVEDLKKYNKEYANNLQPDQELFIKDPNLNVLHKMATATTSKKRKPINIKNKNEIVLGNQFAMPVKWSGVSSPFGNRFHPVLKRYILHTGVDLKAKYVPLHAAKDGKVIYAGYMSGYGKIIIIDHGNGYQTRSAHLNNIYVKNGNYVKSGEIIGKTGMTGRVTGPHLHFEIRKDNRPYDPMKYLRR
ncbi:peptidoglycan DD-metalloendopeptidase family protein [Cetobacterium sp. SF1]|uniref:M23 family metallopeptidase n=1 Tax=unclassified Cetobacterium TaxID=2630983 RepID=UPI003CF6BFB7